MDAVCVRVCVCVCMPESARTQDVWPHTRTLIGCPRSAVRWPWRAERGGAGGRRMVAACYATTPGHRTERGRSLVSVCTDRQTDMQSWLGGRLFARAASSQGWRRTARDKKLRSTPPDSRYRHPPPAVRFVLSQRGEGPRSDGQPARADPDSSNDGSDGRRSLFCAHVRDAVLHAADDRRPECPVPAVRDRVLWGGGGGGCIAIASPALLAICPRRINGWTDARRVTSSRRPVFCMRRPCRLPERSGAVSYVRTPAASSTAGSSGTLFEDCSAGSNATGGD